MNPFKLSTLGEEVYLFSGDSRTNLTGYVHGFKFGAQAAGISFGRYVDSTGQEQFVSQRSKTLNTTNSGPLLSPVVITEIMYHPPDVFTNAVYWNNTEDEYIELFNRTDQAVSLFDAQVTTNTWKMSGQIDFAFPSTFILAPRSYVVLASFDPVLRPDWLAAFRDKYQIAANVSVLGPFQSALDNHGGTITLAAPESGMASDAGTNAVPYILEEKIEYASLPPWPSGADGDGFSLNRIDSAAFGNDAGNWAVGVPTPGSASEPNNELRIGSITVQGQITISFSAVANHSYVVEYTDTLNPPQWSELTEIEPRQTNFTATATDNVNSATRYYRAVDRFSHF
jgi:hypothetical protein